MAVTAPCGPWADLDDVAAATCATGDCDALIDSNPTALTAALADASFLLNAWSAFQYQGGKTGCTATVRPVSSYGPARSVPEWGPGPSAGTWNPNLWGANFGGWTVPTSMLDTNGWGICGCNASTPLARRGCCEYGPSQIGLGAYPVNSVTQVLIDGVALDSSEYRIDDDRWLVRLPPSGSTSRPYWPTCQRVDLPTTEDNTFAVTFNYGGLVPPIGTNAAVALGCAIAAERCNGVCLLAPGVTQVNREGVSLQLVRPTEDVLDSMPSEVRTFVNAVNPGMLRHRPRVFSPDVAREVVRPTWP